MLYLLCFDFLARSTEPHSRGFFSDLWLYIGWRAMRAHERLAAAAEKKARETQ